MPRPPTRDPVRKKLICNLVAAAYFEALAALIRDRRLTKAEMDRALDVVRDWLRAYALIRCGPMTLFSVLSVLAEAAGAEEMTLTGLAASIARRTRPEWLDEPDLAAAIAADEAAIEALGEVLL